MQCCECGRLRARSNCDECNRAIHAACADKRIIGSVPMTTCSGCTPELILADDDRYVDSVRALFKSGIPSTSLIQRRIGVGYWRAVRLKNRIEKEIKT